MYILGGCMIQFCIASSSQETEMLLLVLVSKHLLKLLVYLQALANTPRPARPGYCMIGQPTRIKVNHFEVKCNITQAYHYDVVLNRLKKCKLFFSTLPVVGMHMHVHSLVLFWSA